MLKQWAKPMNLVPLTTIPVSDRCVFEPQTLCFLIWRSAPHSVQENFLTIHCGPVKYIFLKSVKS